MALKRLLGMAGLVVGSLFLFVPSAFADAAGAPDVDFTMKKWIALATGMAIAIAAFGGALAQGRAVAAALEGIARNPGASGKMFVPMILGLALIESLVIYAFVIAIMLFGKL